MRVYISGLYTNGDTQHNIEVARQAMWELMRLKHVPFCPHTMTAGGEHAEGLTYDDLLRIDLEWLGQCEVILMLDGWEESKGAKIEHEWAKYLGLKIFYDIADMHSNCKYAQPWLQDTQLVTI